MPFRTSGARRDRLLLEHERDTYALGAKLPEPTACPDCGAVYRRGRWAWAPAPADARPRLCPACHRIRDDYPGGCLALRGEFSREHRAELLGLARNVAERARGLHPLRRIMDIEEDDEQVVVTTTDPKLARSIAAALHHAYEGKLDYSHARGGNLLRVTWTR
jgi:NMD protein affecting ribosome stability and mRNA decay